MPTPRLTFSVSELRAVSGRQDPLYAQALNLSTLEPEGEPVVVADSPAQPCSIFGNVALQLTRALGTT